MENAALTTTVFPTCPQLPPRPKWNGSTYHFGSGRLATIIAWTAGSAFVLISPQQMKIDAEISLGTRRSAFRFASVAISDQLKQFIVDVDARPQLVALLDIVHLHGQWPVAEDIADPA